MDGVIIGIDPHKGSHTAVVLDEAENMLCQLRVNAMPGQVDQLRRWAATWPERMWAIEGARGLGQLLAQQLLAAGERVVDVQPKLAARVRLLNTGQVNKNDPNDARSVAVAALRSSDLHEVAAEDDTAVLKLWARRYRNLGSARTQLVCRLHAVLCELVPGGFARRISAVQVIAVLAGITAHGRVAEGRLQLAHDLVEDLHRLDDQRREVKQRLTRAVTASKTTLTEIYGVGPVVAATVLGYVGDIRRFPSRDHFAAYNGTAPVEVSSGNRKIYRLSRRGNRQLNHAIHMAAVTQIRNHGTAGRVYYDRKVAEGMTRKSALRALKRKISDALYARMIADAHAKTGNSVQEDPGGQSGNDAASSATGSHPDAGSSEQPLPGRDQPYVHRPNPSTPPASRRRTRPSTASGSPRSGQQVRQ